jgi:hypothetical protein
MNRPFVIGLVVAVSVLLGLAAGTGATSSGSADSSRVSALAVARPAATDAVRSPIDSYDITDWRLNPATGHYYAQVENLNWAQAEAYAVRLGGHLVTINDQAEEEWLTATFGIAEQFIGFNDLAADGTWVWSSGEPVTYVHFPPGQPEADSPDEVAGLEADPDGSGGVWWADQSAAGVYPALLEVPREPSTGWLVGRVTSEGLPRAGITVEALAEDPAGTWLVKGSATTDASGAYEIGDLLPAEYRVVFRGGDAFVDQFWSGQPSAGAARSVELTAGGVVTGIDGAMALSGYRASGPLVPALTTHIPTPADVSTDPTVVGANLALAALVLILFTAAGELLNRTLAENEEALARALRPARSVRRLRERADAALRGTLGTGRLLNVVRLAGIAVLYGLIFSILDRTWDPLSVTGLWLFISMAIAFGIIGIADDLACWLRARRWGAAVDLDIRTGNLILALASTVVSRLVVLVPGIMIGSPEAIQVADDRLDKRRRGQLAATGLTTLLGIGAAAWLLTAVTAAALPGTADGDLRVLVGGLEALLLVIFAVAIQNAFAQFLAFRGTAGRALLETHRLTWLLGLLGVTFLFWHTLVNPRGDLATALQATNVLVFVAIALGFTVASVGVWAGFRLSRWRGTRSRGAAAPGVG